MRLWAAVCLAMFIAFWLELANPFWAGTTAGIVCQPVLGASLRKGWFRMLGTIIGAVASVVISAAFPQSRAGFLVALALWGAICGLVASILRNFASYAAALAGYTAIIICADQLGAVGGPAVDNAFNLAVTRATEICIGIVSAGVVLVATDLGGARRRLAGVLADLAAQIAGGLLGALDSSAAGQPQARTQRRGFIARVGTLDTLIDQAMGETSALRFRPRALQAAEDGLFTALSAWRALSVHLERFPQAEPEARALLRQIPPALRSTGPPQRWHQDAERLRQDAIATARLLVAMPAGTVSARLLADRTAEGLLGIARALNAVLVLENPVRAAVRPGIARLRVPDMLPPLINAVRVFLTMGVASLVWIQTAWPDGGMALVFAAITVILFSPREDAALATARGFLLGTMITAALAAVAAFALLPQQPTFTGFCAVAALVLIPAGAMSAQSWQTGMFVAIATNFIPLLDPSNPMSFDPLGFYNLAVGIVGGVGIAIGALRLLPPLPPSVRARRLVALTLRDLRRLAAGSLPLSAAGWESHVYGRLSAMPAAADPLQRARLVAALSVGGELVRLNRTGAQFPMCSELLTARTALAQGDVAVAVEALRRFDTALAQVSAQQPGAARRLRARGTSTAIAEALAQHSAYFAGEVAA